MWCGMVGCDVVGWDEMWCGVEGLDAMWDHLFFFFKVISLI